MYKQNIIINKNKKMQINKKNKLNFLILSLILLSFFSSSNALKIIIGDKVQENVIIKTIKSKNVTIEKIFNTYANVFTSELPESYKYIKLNFTGIDKNSKLFLSLQKLVYADLLPNAKIKINPKANFSKKLFYLFANNFAKKKIFEVNIENKKYTTESDLEKLKKEVIYININTLQNKDQLFNKKIKRMYDVFKTITTKHYSSEKIDKNKMLNTAIEGMAIGSKDKFTTYFPPQKNESFQTSLIGKYEGIGAYVHMIKPGILEVIAPLYGTPAQKAGIQAKDIFLEIGGKKITKENSLLEVVSWIKGKAGTKVKIKIKRGKEIIEIEVERKKITIENVTTEKFGKDIFYIKILFFGESVSNDFKKALEKLKKEKNIKKVIIDLRNNPGGYLDKVADMLSFFVPKFKKTVIVKQKDNQYSYKSKGYNLIDFGKYRIIILQNKGSASASEIMIGTIKDYFPKTTIIGETSYGKGSVQTIKAYKDGSSLKYTIAKWFTGKTETGIDLIGITPDIKIKDKVKNRFIKDNKEKDKVLEKAKNLK